MCGGWKGYLPQDSFHRMCGSSSRGVIVQGLLLDGLQDYASRRYHRNFVNLEEVQRDLLHAKYLLGEGCDKRNSRGHKVVVQVVY